MTKKKLGNILAWVLLAALSLTMSASAAWRQDGTAGSFPVLPAPAVLTPQAPGVHGKYMSGDEQGLFQPEALLTRAELAQVLCQLTTGQPLSTPVFFDVAGDAWYAPAVAQAAGLGLMSGTNGFFRPEEPATRAECALALAQLVPGSLEYRSFPDVWPDHWAYGAICRTTAYGLFQGDESGRFRPDDGISRCEAAAVFNRLLGRAPNAGELAEMEGLRYFPDVPTTHWAYGEVMEAAVSHRYTQSDAGTELWTWAEREPTVLADGPHRINGRLYWVQDGYFLRNASAGSLYFDQEGRYTTGNQELDRRLNDIVEELTDSSMTRDQKLRALFNYIRDNYTYLKRPLISKGQTGWEADYALFFLEKGKGNCYNFSAAYCLLARELGLPAYIVVGSVLNSPHGWVEIELDGATYMFDTQLEWRYLHDWGKTGYNLFKMSPNKTPFRYTR